MWAKNAGECASEKVYGKMKNGPRRPVFTSILAEGEGFEPSIRITVCRLSRAVHSTTLPPFHGALRELELYGGFLKLQIFSIKFSKKISIGCSIFVEFRHILWTSNEDLSKKNGV